eukprot:6188193-Pleurochrysis_carterae.AAC.6
MENNSGLFELDLIRNGAGSLNGQPALRRVTSRDRRCMDGDAGRLQGTPLHRPREAQSTACRPPSTARLNAQTLNVSREIIVGAGAV